MSSPVYAELQRLEMLEDEMDDDRDSDYVPDSNSESDSDDFVPVGLIFPLLSGERAGSSSNSRSNEEFEHAQTAAGKEKVHNKETKTKIDKKHFCVFCGKDFTKLKRHLISQHQNERGMFGFLSASKDDKKAEFAKLRNAGDHIHNTEVLKTGRGELVVKRIVKTPNAEKKEIVPCSHCLGYFQKRDLWRHKCPKTTNAENVPKRQAVRSGRLLLPAAEGDESTGVILESLRNDRISTVVRHDKLIKMMAKREFQRNGHDRDIHAHIRNKIRELGRLLINLRDRTGNESAQLKDFMRPQHFQDIVEATRNISGYTEESHSFKIPALAMKLGHSIHKCSVLLKTQAIETHDNATRMDCDAFNDLYTIRWDSEVSSQANRTIYQNKKNNTKELSLSDDVSTLSKHLLSQGEEARVRLQHSQASDVKQAWMRLAEVTLTSVILFNRRRQGEASKMTIKDYTDGLHKQSHNDDVLAGLTKFEQALCQRMTRIEITGKRGRIVPVILTDETKASTDLLLAMREKAGIASNNPYFFARANNESDGHLRGSDCLRKMTEEVPLQQPQLLRSTTLRKQIATLTQLVNLKDNELDIIAQYMGHDIRVHREHYRLPSGTVQVAKVAKLLVALEKGQVPTISDHDDDNIDEEESQQEDNSDWSEESDFSPVKAAWTSDPRADSRQDKRKTSTKTAQRNMSGRKRWSAPEEKACLKSFNRSISIGILPGKADIVAVQQDIPVLQHRSWIQIKNFIRNHIRKNQK